MCLLGLQCMMHAGCFTHHAAPLGALTVGMVMQQLCTVHPPCSRYASQSAWCIRRGWAPAAAASCQVLARCHVSTLHRVEVDAVAVWEAGAIAWPTLTSRQGMQRQHTLR